MFYIAFFLYLYVYKLLIAVFRSQISLCNMGQQLDKPKTEKEEESGTANGLKYALSAMQGWRLEMEVYRISCFLSFILLEVMYLTIF